MTAKGQNVTFKTGNNGDTVQPDLPQRTAEQIHVETIPTDMKDKRATGNKQHGSIKGKWCLANPTAFSDEMTGSVEAESCK